MKFCNLGPKFGLVIVAVIVSAQLIAQNIDYTREQYDAYQKCSVVADPSAKQACMLAFIQAFLDPVRYWGVRQGVAGTDQKWRTCESTRGGTSLTEATT